jgi:hypothetical protein
MRRALAIGAITCMVGVAGSWAPAAASSGQIEINIGHGWEHDTSSPLFSIGNIVPGWQQVRTFQIRNDSGAASALDLSSNGIVERENGCVHGESAVDTTCGPDQGELGRKLIFSVYIDPSDGSNFGTDPMWSGTLYDLEQPLVLEKALAAHGSTAVKLVAELPFATGDEVETDQVGFNLRLDLAQAGTGVLGEKIGRVGVQLPGASASGPSGSLPFTGMDVATIGLLGLALLTSGGAVVIFARRRRQTPAP